MVRLLINYTNDIFDALQWSAMFYKNTEQLILHKEDDGLWYVHMPVDTFR
jgi:hypothetical protein